MQELERVSPLVAHPWDLECSKSVLQTSFLGPFRHGCNIKVCGEEDGEFSDLRNVGRKLHMYPKHKFIPSYIKILFWHLLLSHP